MTDGERFNICTHLLGLVLAVAGTAWLIPGAIGTSDSLTLVGAGVFAVTCIGAFGASCTFHARRGPTRLLWERLDHAVIYTLIAGTYTPFALSAPRHPANLVLLALLWTIALTAAGAALRAKSRLPSVLSYAGLGWLCVMCALPVALRSPRWTADLLLLGAGMYSAGTWFYANPRGWRHAHGVWHLFVVAGAMLHFGAIRQTFAFP